MLHITAWGRITQKVSYFSPSSNRLGVWLHLVNTVRMGAGHMLSPPLPIFINEAKVGTQQMPAIASSCKIKFLTVLFFSVNRL